SAVDLWVVSVALEGPTDDATIEIALRAAARLGAKILVIRPAKISDEGCGVDEDNPNWSGETAREVERILGLQKRAEESKVLLTLEMPCRGTIAGDLEGYRRMARMLVRHRVFLSVDSGEVAALGLSVN